MLKLAHKGYDYNELENELGAIKFGERNRNTIIFSLKNKIFVAIHF